MATSYPDTSLVEKLDLRPGYRMAIINAPEGYLAILGELPKGAEMVEDGEDLDFVQVFATNRQELVDQFPRAKRQLKRTGMIWVSWPKLSSTLAADLRDSVVREVGLAHGLVDIKVTAIDETWSGLKFVFRS